MKRYAKSWILLVFLVVLLSGTTMAEYDLGGQTVTIGVFNNWGPYYEEGDGADWADYVEEKFNVKLAFKQISHGELVDTIMTGATAGESVADVFQVQSGAFLQLASVGALKRLDDVLDQQYYDSLPFYQQRCIKDYTSYDEKTYGFSIGDGISALYGLVWNKSLFEREGLPNLYELQAAGEWTWEKFREIARKASRDTDGDGKIDQWGFSSQYRAVEPHLVVNWGYSNNALVYQKENDRMVFTYDRKPALETLQYWNELINVDKSVYNGEDGVNGLDNFIAGNIGMLLANVNFSSWHCNYAQMADDYGYVMIPKGPNDGKHVAPPEFTTMFVLPVTVENPAEIVEVASALQKTTDKYLDNEERVNQKLEEFGNQVRDFESVESRRLMYEHIYFEVSGGAPFLGKTDFFGKIREVLYGHESPASAMDSVAPQVQAEVDKFYNEK